MAISRKRFYYKDENEVRKVASKKNIGARRGLVDSPGRKEAKSLIKLGKKSPKRLPNGKKDFASLNFRRGIANLAKKAKSK